MAISIPGRRSIRSALVLALLVVSGTATSAHAAATAATNPCKLVTAADAKAALGGAVATAAARPAGLYQDCTYKSSKGGTLIVLIRKLSKTDFTKSAKANPGKITAVPGIGSAAYSVAGRTLLFWKNGTEVTLSIFGVPAGLHAEEQVGKRAAARL